ncbi:hypothetical protein DBV39_00820 [Orrella marina]|uniref:Uncharacterized protein n=1 Tax=Orrella marina TaxID=2163011 RepID=A0A2R4XFA9_9BURK|nr:hypothetical protein DBV39_00820 [Orrella marina]
MSVLVVFVDLITRTVLIVLVTMFDMWHSPTMKIATAPKGLDSRQPDQCEMDSRHPSAFSRHHSPFIDNMHDRILCFF